MCFINIYVSLAIYNIKYSNIMRRKTKDDFINQAQLIHNDKYDYSKVNYINCETKVCIICPEHGEFWQRPSNHLTGQGCPVCKKSKLELEVINKFSDVITQQKFDWLKYKKSMSLDFYIPDKNIAIECQ